MIDMLERLGKGISPNEYLGILIEIFRFLFDLFIIYVIIKRDNIRSITQERILR
jgi:hypothetical protein